MGQEIAHAHFSREDFARFSARLAEETARLETWFREGRFAPEGNMVGFELEAWLIDARGRPAPANEAFLEAVDDPMVVPELSRFNVELNGRPQRLEGDAFSRLEAGLAATWARCQQVAGTMGLALCLAGILPTVRPEDLCLENMSPLRRYRALNEQVLRQRQGAPLRLDIPGREPLHLEHADVMLEAAATSFQIHLKVAPAEAVRTYNLSQILSAPMVALAANAPFLFGHDLWDETRIPLFEQAVEVGGFGGASHGPLRRVGFGSGYVRESLFECFRENLEHFPPLLPMRFSDTGDLPHLRLHNGTIWRWNRPLIGFDADGRPHLRIEHRVVPAGPSLVDCVANLACYVGLVRCFLDEVPEPEARLPFSAARDNFYACARQGLDARIQWWDGEVINVRRLLLERLLGAASRGLARLGIARADREKYLGVVRQRVARHLNGTAWQRDWVERHGRDWPGLVRAMRAWQASGRPVHEWELGDRS
ncbi:MAG: glutamate--cysteine ligase [Gammaproteobacteria bacterium]|nr:MAG: glutamate--cysteine ligase [Gammaproteobacteria bacterium]